MYTLGSESIDGKISIFSYFDGISMRLVSPDGQLLIDETIFSQEDV
jgi:hypothetical protein